MHPFQARLADIAHAVEIDVVVLVAVHRIDAKADIETRRILAPTEILRRTGAIARHHGDARGAGKIANRGDQQMSPLQHRSNLVRVGMDGQVDRIAKGVRHIYMDRTFDSHRRSGGKQPARQQRVLLVHRHIGADLATHTAEAPVQDQAQFVTHQGFVAVRIDFRAAARVAPDAEILHLATEISRRAQIRRVCRANGIVQTDPEFKGSLPVDTQEARRAHSVQIPLEREGGLVVDQCHVVPGAEANGTQVDRRGVPDPHPHLTAGFDFDLAVMPAGIDRLLAEFGDDHSRALGVEGQFDRHRLVVEEGPQIARDSIVVDAVELQRRADDAVVVVRRDIPDNRATEFIELPQACEPGLRGVDVAVHIRTDLRVRANGVPQRHIVNLTAERRIAAVHLQRVPDLERRIVGHGIVRIHETGCHKFPVQINVKAVGIAIHHTGKVIPFAGFDDARLCGDVILDAACVRRGEQKVTSRIQPQGIIARGAACFCALLNDGHPGFPGTKVERPIGVEADGIVQLEPGFQCQRALQIEASAAGHADHITVAIELQRCGIARLIGNRRNLRRLIGREFHTDVIGLERGDIKIVGVVVQRIAGQRQYAQFRQYRIDLHQAHAIGGHQPGSRLAEQHLDGRAQGGGVVGRDVDLADHLPRASAESFAGRRDSLIQMHRQSRVTDVQHRAVLQRLDRGGVLGGPALRTHADVASRLGYQQRVDAVRTQLGQHVRNPVAAE